nr:hypothetical protein TorRG33x02_081340 [Ipomoea batatas]
MILDLGLREFEPVSGADHHRSVVGPDHASLPELHQGGERHARVGTREHAGGIRHGHGVHKLLLRRLLHDPAGVFEREHRPVYGHRVADLDSGGERGGRRHRREFRPAGFVVEIERISPSKSVSMLSTNAPLAIGWTSCAMEILSAGRKTMEGIFAAAQTVIPKSLKLPVWLIPQCFTHKSLMLTCLFPNLSAQKRFEFPSNALTISSSAISGKTHSFLDHTPDPYGQAVFPTRESNRFFQYSPSNCFNAATSCCTSSNPPELHR